MNNTQIYNQITKRVIESYNTFVRPDDVTVLASMETKKHYTLTHILKGNLITKLVEIQEKLKAIDDSLILTPPGNLHVTLFWTGLECNLEQHLEEIEQSLENKNMEFYVEDLLFAPGGISFTFYPKTEDLINAKRALYDLCGLQVQVDEKFVTMWSTIARFSQRPKNEVKQYVKENQNMKIGTYTVDSFTLYTSTNKILDNPTEIAKYICK